MKSVDEVLQKYTALKKEFGNVCKKLEDCEDVERKMYGNICIEYSKGIKELQMSIEKRYGVKLNKDDF